MLPYFEETARFEGLKRDEAISNQMAGNTGCCGPNASNGTLVGNAITNGNGDIAAQKVPVFLCPSDPGDPYLAASGVYSISAGSPASSLRGAKSNYDFSVDSDYRCGAWDIVVMSRRRMFGQDSDASTANILDGTSNTIAIAESTLDMVNGTRAAWAYRAWVQVGIDVASGGTYNPSTGVATGTGINKFWYTNLSQLKYGRIGSWNWAGSLHPGGCQVTMGDGSVRFLRETSSLVALNKLSAMADGNANSDVP